VLKRVRKRLLQTRSKIELRYFSIYYTLLLLPQSYLLVSHDGRFRYILHQAMHLLPPENSASKYAFTMSFASSVPTILAPNAMMFALLCSFVSLADTGSLTTAARTPFTLLAAMEIPIPVPQIKTPASTSPLATALPTFAP